MKLSKDIFIKFVFLGLLIALIVNAYLLFQKNKTPTTKLECLKLGSDMRAKTCIQLLNTTSTKLDLPLNQLKITDVTIENKGVYGIKINGTIENQSSSIATQISLKINFKKDGETEPFHYQVINPFDESDVQIQPNSKKSFTKMLYGSTIEILSPIPNWQYSIVPYGAKVLEN